MRRSIRVPATLTLAISAFFALEGASAEAGGKLFRRRAQPVVETVAAPRPDNRVAPSPMLGTFQPTPYLRVGSVGLGGGGNSPFGGYAREQSLTVYGPLSAFRQVAAPVNTVVRGYDGAPTVVEGIGFSNPFQPTLSPFVYPTRANNYSALRYQATPPQLDRGIMWIDQN